MTKPEGPQASSLQTVNGMREIVFSQTRQIDACLHLLNEKKVGADVLVGGDPDVLRVITTLMHMVGISGHSLLKLTEEIGLGVRDAFPLARGISEGAINACYIMAGGTAIAERAVRHAEARSYSDLKREWNAAGLALSVGSTLELPPEEKSRLEELAAEFTSKQGRDKSWTDKSLSQRLDKIGEAFSQKVSISLNASAFSIYRHASEIMHGSYFGAAYFWGLTVPGKQAPSSPDELKSTLLSHQFSVLMAAIFSYAGLVECFGEYAELPEMRQVAQDTLDRLKSLPDVADALSGASAT